MVVARRAAPVDVLRRLAGIEAAILPETLAGAGAAASVQAVDHIGGDASGLSTRRGSDAASVRLSPSARRIAVISPLACLFSTAINRSEPSIAGSHREWCVPRREPRTSAPCDA